MDPSTPHKFHEKIPFSYEEYFRNIYTNFVKFLRTLEIRLGKEHFLEILTRWSQERGVEMAGNRRVATFTEFKDYWKEASAQEFFKHATTVDFPEESDSVLQCNYTECLWAKTFREMNAGELGKILVCDPDFPYAQTLNSKLKLERTKTLMEGHDCCNHRYVWEE
ncbi:MAG: L-2-amino-thiazoline-4-carboxylic acid hydrolase [Candidatus Thorarchaeota archaeon]|jgi:hypothetical protein